MSLLAKVWFDLWQDKSRTLQVVLVIALGAIGVGLVIGGRNLVAGTVSESWQAAEPPHIQLSVSPPLTPDQMEGLARIDGVDELEGLYNSGVEWRIAGGSEWQTGVLRAREDYQNQLMSILDLMSGAWPERNTVAIGQISVGGNNVFEGDVVELRVGDNTRTVTVVGTIDSRGPSPVFQDTFYADLRTFERLTGRNSVDLVQMRAAGGFDQAAAEATDLRIQDYFEGLGVDSVGVQFPFQERIVPPETPPAAAILNAIFLLLGVIGVIVVILGIFLVYNSISAIVMQQVNQIGVMKAIGADAWQVVSGYLVLVMSYGVLAAIVSIPIGAFAAFGLQNFFADFLNLEINAFAVDGTAVLAQVLICLGATLIAALIPLRSGMRITVREAISTYGLTGAVSLIDRMVAGAKNVPYTLLLTIGNTFRNRRRVVVIEIALVVAGTIFMMVMGVNDATNYTFGDKLASVHNYQVALSTEGTVRAVELEAIARDGAGVTAVESWLILPASARPLAQSDSSVFDARVRVFGQPPQTTMYSPDMIAGRWLQPGDTNAAVVSQQIAGEKGFVPGDILTLETNSGRTLTVEVVGIHFDPATNTSIHMPLTTLQREWGQYGRANSVWLQADAEGLEAQTAVAGATIAALEQRGISVAPSSAFGEQTIAGIVEQSGEGFSIIINLLAVMAVVIALVGGVGLSGVLSLSVLERRREIGVMRAIGASSWQVIRLFVGEGMLLGLISWLIALPLGVVAAYFLTTQGLTFALNQQLVYSFAPGGAVAWLVIITILAMVASALPARGAARISVRESLAYS